MGIKLGILWCGGLLLLGAGEAVPVDPLGVAAQWAGAGVMGTALLYLLKFYIPARDKQASEERTAKDAQFSAVIRELCDRHDQWEQLRHTDHLSTEKILREMIAHCAGHIGRDGVCKEHG